MALTNSDIMMIDSTIIIGLLILLTFSSVSSTFVQTETSSFFSEWYGLQNDLEKINLFLLECTSLRSNDPYYVETFESDLINEFIYYPREGLGTRGDEEYLVNELTDSLKQKFMERCDQLVVEAFEKKKQLEVLDAWGLEFNYLKEGDTRIVESDRMQEMASGPFWVIMINLVMVFPFVASAILDTILSRKRANEDNSATNPGLYLMIAGLVVVAIGLSLIGLAFYNSAAPFLDNNI